MVEHLFIIQKEDENMFQQASCSCDIEIASRNETASMKNQDVPRLVEIISAMLTAISIKNSDKPEQKDEDVQNIINEILFITQNLR